MTLLHKLKAWTVKTVFNRYYGHFIFPFFKADAERLNLSETERQQYVEAVTAWVESKAFHVEHKAMVADFYQELAVKSLGVDQVTGYRLALTFIKHYEARLMALAEEGRLMKAIEKTNRNLP